MYNALQFTEFASSLKTKGLIQNAITTENCLMMTNVISSLIRQTYNPLCAINAKPMTLEFLVHCGNSDIATESCILFEWLVNKMLT